MLSSVLFSRVTCRVSSAFTPHECGTEEVNLAWPVRARPFGFDLHVVWLDKRLYLEIEIFVIRSHIFS